MKSQQHIRPNQFLNGNRSILGMIAFLLLSSVVLSAQISIDLTVTNPTCANFTNGEISSQVSGGTAPYTYLWSNGTNFPILYSASAGSYSLTVTDATGATQTVSTEVTDPDQLVLSVDIVYDDISCGETPTATVTAVISGGTEPYSISWSNGAVGPVVTGLTPGGYFLIVDDAQGCHKKFKFKIEKPVILNCKIDPTQPDCTPGSTGSATVTVSGGVPPFTFTWSNGATTQTITDLEPGPYSVTVEDSQGCTTVCNTKITQPKIPTCGLTPTNPNCGANGSISVFINHGLAPFTVEWTSDTGVSGTVTSSDNPILIDNLPEGNYTVTFTDANGCGSTCETPLVDNGELLFQATPNPEICEGDNGSIDVTVSVGTAPFTITWSGTEEGTAEGVESPFTIENLSAGTYNIEVTDATGCTKVKNGVVVEEEEYDLNVSVTHSCDTTVMPQGVVTVTWDDREAPYDLIGDGPLGPIEILGYTSTTFVLTNAPNGTYTFSVTDSNGCEGLDSTTVVCPPDAGECTIMCEAEATPVNCEEENSGTITVTTTGSTGPFTIELDGVVQTTEGTSPFVITDLAEGTYTVTVIDQAIDSCFSTCIATVEGPEPLEVTLSDIVDVICDQPGSFKLTYTSGNGPITCAIEPGNTSVTLDDVGSMETIDGLSAGTYIVTCMDSCFSQVDTVVIDAINNLAFTATASCFTDQTVGSIAINITSGTAPFTTVWTNTGTGVADSVTFSETSFIIEPLASGAYKVKTTDANGCMQMQDVPVICCEIENCTTSSTPDECDPDGICDGTITVGEIPTGTPPFKIIWELVGSTADSVENVDLPFIITGLCAGEYKITVIDSLYCMSICTENVEGPTPLSADLTNIVDQICETPGSFDITYTSGTGPLTCTVSPGDIEVTIDAIGSAVTVGDLEAGTYTITCSDSCFTQVDTIEIEFIDNLEFTIEASCNDATQIGSIDVTITSGISPYTIVLEDLTAGTVDSIMIAEDSLDITPVTEGAYKITIIDANGCMGMETDTVECVPPPCMVTCTTTSTPDNCDPDDVCDGTITVTIETDCEGPYLLTLAGPSADTIENATFPFTFDGLCAGDYDVTVTDSTGATTSCPITVEGPAPLNADLTNIVDQICETPGSFDITYTSGNGPLTCTVSPGDIEVTIDTIGGTVTVGDLEAGTYTVTCSDSCFTQVDTIEIEFIDNLEFTVEASCDAATQVGSIDLNITSGTSPYTVILEDLTAGTTDSITISEDTLDITPVTEGAYKLTVIDANGCMGMETDTVECVPPPCMIMCTTTSTPDDCGPDGVCDGTITVSIETDCEGPYLLTLAGPSADTIENAIFPFTFDGLCAGDYDVTVTDSTGATTSCPITVEGPDPLNVAISDIVDQVCDSLGSFKLTYVSGNGPILCTITPGNIPLVLDEANSMVTVGDLAAGTYTVTCSDSCFTQVDTVVIDSLNNLAFTAAGTCADDSLQIGSIAVTITSGTAPFIVEWMGIGNATAGADTITVDTLSISPLDTGMYKITIVDANGCMQMDTVMVDCEEDPDPCMINCFTTTTPDDCDPDGVCDGTITVTIETDCEGPYTLTWTGPSMGTIANATFPFTIDGLCAGDYEVMVTDTTGATSSCPITVEGPDSLDIGITAEPVICEQPGSITLTYESGNGPVICTLVPGDIEVTLEEENDTETIDGLDAGTYIITSMDSCFTIMDTIVIDSIGDLQFETSFECVETGLGDVTVTFTSGTAPFIVEWMSIDGGGIMGADTTDADSFVIESLMDGEYKITVTDTFGCTGMDTIIVDCPCTISCSTESTPTDCVEPCNGTITVTVETDCEAPFVVSYSGPSSGIITDVTFPFVIEGLCEGDYVVIVSDTLGTQSSCPVTVGGPPPPVLDFDVQNAICETPGSIKATYESGNGPISGTISGPSIAGSFTLDMIGDMTTFENLPAGSYTFIYSDTCAMNMDTTVIEVMQEDREVNVMAERICDPMNPDSITIMVTVTGETGAPYDLTIEGPVVETAQIFEETLTFTLPNGNYTITAIDTLGCDGSTTVEECDENCVLNCFTSSTNTDCTGPCTGTVTVTLEEDMTCEGPFTVTWQGADGVISMAQEATFPFTIDGLCAGVYIIMVIDETTGTMTTCASTVGENITPLVLDINATPQICTTLGSITLSYSQGNGPANCVISNADTTITLDLEGMGSTETVELPAGTYTITCTDPCDTVMQTVEIMEEMRDVGITATVECDTLNPGVNIIVTIDVLGEVTPPSTVVISNNDGPVETITVENEAVVVVLPNGNYTVDATDSLGCMASTTIDSLDCPAPCIDFEVDVFATNVVCDSLGSIGITYIAGEGPVSCTVPALGETRILQNPGDTAFFFNLDIGTYPMIFSSVDAPVNCPPVEEVAEIIDESYEVDIDISLDLTPPVDACTNIELSTTVEPDSETYSFTWEVNPSDTTFADASSITHAPLANSTYSLTVVDTENGCTGEDTEEVAVTAICEDPFVYIPNAFSPNGDGENDIFRIRSVFINRVICFIVYDRWGEEVFSSTTVEGGTVTGWDGTFRGKECPPDVFGYYIEVECIGGLRFQQKGNVTLFR